MSAELAPGQVTTADLYRELVGLRGDVSKVLIRQERVELVNQLADQIHADHENRIRALETARAKLVGACLAGSAVMGTAAGWIAIGLHH